MQCIAMMHNDILIGKMVMHVKVGRRTAKKKCRRFIKIESWPAAEARTIISQKIRFQNEPETM